ELLGSMQALEHSEQSIVVLHIESDTVVANEIDDLAAAAFRPDDDASRPARPGELERVAEQIDEELLEQQRIGITVRQFLNLHSRSAILDLLRHLVHDPADKTSEGNPALVQRLPAESRELEQAGDQLAHLPDILTDQ